MSASFPLSGRSSWNNPVSRGAATSVPGSCCFAPPFASPPLTKGGSRTTPSRPPTPACYPCTILPACITLYMLVLGVFTTRTVVGDASADRVGLRRCQRREHKDKYSVTPLNDQPQPPTAQQTRELLAVFTTSAPPDFHAQVMARAQAHPQAQRPAPSPSTWRRVFLPIWPQRRRTLGAALMVGVLLAGLAFYASRWHQTLQYARQPRTVDPAHATPRLN